MLPVVADLQTVAGSRLNPLLSGVAAPPIAEAQGWVRGRTFPLDKPLIDLAQAVPGYPPPDALVEHLARRLADPAVHRYTDILGHTRLREALAAHMSAAYAGTIGADQVAITAGCNQAFCLAIMALAQAGDEVILPLPYYFNHRMWLDALGVAAVPLTFRPESGGVPDLDEAASRITGRTRTIVLVTPNNPTGAIYPPEAIEGFYRLAQRHGIALILDETYKDFRPGDEPAHQLFQDPDWPETLIQLYSFSKVFCLTGYRVGSLIAGRRVMESVEKAMDCIAICAPAIGQEAALFGLSELDDWRRGNTALMGERVQAFRTGFERVEGFRLISLGAYFAYVQHPFPDRTAAAVACDLAEQHNLLTLPGSMFGEGQERFLRLAFANVPAGTVPAIVERLSTAAGTGGRKT